MAHLEVDLVAADHKVWSGEARMVSVPAADGEMGILPGHAPALAVLGAGKVRISAVDGQSVDVMVDSGFLSVDADRVTVVVDHADGQAPAGTSR